MAGTAAGAATGGLLASAAQRNRVRYSYTLEFGDRSVSSFITDDGSLRINDCVDVERGQYANIRRVAPVLCAGGPAAVADASHQLEAEQCHCAKDLVLRAATEDELPVPRRKVQILCKS